MFGDSGRDSGSWRRLGVRLLFRPQSLVIRVTGDLTMGPHSAHTRPHTGSGSTCGWHSQQGNGCSVGRAGVGLPPPTEGTYSESSQEPGLCGAGANHKSLFKASSSFLSLLRSSETSPLWWNGGGDPDPRSSGPSWGPFLMRRSVPSAPLPLSS